MSYASFLVLPRVLMHEMPDEWQRRMAALLEEFDEEFPGLAGGPGFTVRAVSLEDGRLVPMPSELTNYRHPQRMEIDFLRGKPGA